MTRPCPDGHLVAASLAAALAAALVACAPITPRAVSSPAAGASAPPAIGINQVGFLPASAKWATVVVAPGEAVARSVRIVHADTGRLAWQGTLGEPAVWPPAQTRVQLLDFSSLTLPGRYRLQVDGLTPSASFTVAPDAYAALGAASLKAFYFNRASTELQPAHAGPWARAAGHPDTHVRVHVSAAGPGRPAGSLISAPKGWYDAGDYNKYIVNSGITVYTLLAALEHFPAHFQQQNLRIPESGNSLPDILDEALWNLEWMLAMQDPADGGVYHKLTNLNFDGTVMPAQATAERYVVQKTTAATLDFAAVMAMASRVMATYETQRSGLARQMRMAAERAWAWAQAHPAVIYRQPPDVHTGGYDDDQLADEFAWAAAELYVTTRDDRYYAALQADRLDIGVPGWRDVGALAWITLAHHRATLTPAADRALISSRISSLATTLATRWAASAWRVSLQADDIHWGSNSTVLNQALMLIQGYRLGGDRRQLDAAQSALDYVLGRNALGLSMVTGFGERAARHPHHRPSEADGVADPVPGFLVGGPNPGQQDAKGCPVPYPSRSAALSYIDHYCSWASNEVAINWNAPLAYISAALQVLTPGATGDSR